MTPLMMLALTLPPSLAFVIERWMAGREAQARKLSEAQTIRIDAAEFQLAGHASDLTRAEKRFHDAEAELKRLNEQLTILADRR
jgi:hypothetical protein